MIERPVAIEHFGQLDILHNNVGVAHPVGPLELDDAAFQRTMDINVGSVHRTVRAVLPHFLAQGIGAIVNVSSLAAIRWSGYSYFAYYASKAAMNEATVAIALQYADRGIRANVIMPGVIDTPLVYKQISAQYSSVEEMVAARLGGADEEARLTLEHCQRRSVSCLGGGALHYRRLFAS